MLRCALVVAMALGACATPCESLKERALDCGYAPAADPDEDRNACQRARDTLGREAFESYADCVMDADCGDTEAMDACLQTAVPEDDPCARLLTWAAGCGLEPPESSDSCQGLNDSFTGEATADWVGCITSGGCPAGTDDARYDTCQEEIAPGGIVDLFDACILLTDWSDRCAGIALELPVDGGQDFGTCLAQAEFFTAESYYDYAVCLDTVECDDFQHRLACVDMLEFIDVGSSRDACEELIAFTQTCGSPIGGETEDTCARLFARVTSESLEAFVDCVLSYECGDPEAALVCGPLLEVAL